LTFSGTRIAGWYFTLQGFAILAWWLFLAAFPSAHKLFIPTGASEMELLAFCLPDILVAVPASLAAGVAILAGRRWAVPPAWLAAGAVDYAFVYCAAWSILRHGGWLNVILMAPAALLSTVCALDASASAVVIFRPAKAASSARHVLATLAQISVFWSVILFVIPAAIVYIERQLPWPSFAFPTQRVAAILLFAGCSCLGLVSGMTMASRGSGTPLPFAGTNRLVTSGPYGHVRNPMVIAGLGQGAAVGLWLGSWAVLGYVLLGGGIWHFLVRPAEEQNLRDAFGDAFIRYCRYVRCWLPRLRPFDRTG
jgi:protein-S-isoprenylcysteine O-methyltransferase Ste14